MDKKSIGLDFDGVIHAYDHHWIGAQFITNEPVPGAIDFLRKLCQDERFEVYILSSRSSNPEFKPALQKWLNKNGLEYDYISNIKVVAEKPPLWIYIDDRAMHFTGNFPTTKELNEFKAWDEKDSKKAKPNYLIRMYDELEEVDNFIESKTFNNIVERSKRLGKFIDEKLYGIEENKFSRYEKRLFDSQYYNMTNVITSIRAYRETLRTRIHCSENKLNNEEE